MNRALRAVALLAVFDLAGCGKPLETLDRMAARGEIDPTAPSTASAEITIAAPPEAVWRCVASIDDWPKWWPGLTHAQLQGPLADGTTFIWTDGGNRIHSHLRSVEPQHQIAWTGRAFTLKAIHVWQLEPTGGGNTRVHVAESMEGLGTRWLLSSDELLLSIRDSLGGLKRAAERQPPTP